MLFVRGPMRSRLNASKLHRHWIKKGLEPRMDERIIQQAPLFWIRRDVIDLIPKVIHVANSMLVESCLPDFAAELRADFVGEPAFNALRATLNSVAERRGKQDMHVLGHDCETVQFVSPLIAAVKERFHEQFRIGSPNEETPPLKGRRCDCIGVHDALRRAYLRG